MGIILPPTAINPQKALATGLLQRVVPSGLFIIDYDCHHPK